MNPQEFQSYLDISISIVERKDAPSVAKLKDFLVSLPGPAYIEKALGLTVIHFAENDRGVFDWLLSNQTILSPELDMEAFTQRIVQQRLIHHGCVYRKDFAFEGEQRLVVSQPLIDKLESYFSEGELLLIIKLFQIDPLL